MEIVFFLAGVNDLALTDALFRDDSQFAAQLCGNSSNHEKPESRRRHVSDDGAIFPSPDHDHGLSTVVRDWQSLVSSTFFSVHDSPAGPAGEDTKTSARPQRTVESRFCT